MFEEELSDWVPGQGRSCGKKVQENQPCGKTIGEQLQFGGIATEKEIRLVS